MELDVLAVGLVPAGAAVSILLAWGRPVWHQ